MVKWVDALLDTLLVDVLDHVKSVFLRCLISELDHFLELPCCIYMQEWKWRLLRIECLECQMKHYRAVLSYGIKHNRLLTLRSNFADDVYRLCLQFVKM